MNENIRKLVDYIKLLTGEGVVLAAVDVNSMHLPLILTAGYDFYETLLFGVKVIIVYQHANNDCTPAQIAIQSERIRQTMKLCVAVFVFDSMASYNVQRIIQKRINFIIPGKQMFLPDLLIDLGRKSEADYLDNDDTIPPAAQALLLYHLQKVNLNGKHGEELAMILETSPAGITRAVKWLCVHELAKFEGNKYKTLHLLFDGKELWERAYPFLESPIARVVYSDEDIIGIISGQNALAEYGMLVEANYHITALNKQQYQAIKAKTDPHYGDNRIEVWKYDPRLLSENGFVDKLSLYLSMRNDTDERTQKELKNMINKMPW